MSANHLLSKDPLIIASMKAIRRAARKVHAEGVRTGAPVWVIKGGKLTNLTPILKARARRKAQ